MNMTERIRIWKSNAEGLPRPPKELLAVQLMGAAEYVEELWNALEQVRSELEMEYDEFYGNFNCVRCLSLDRE